MLIPPVRVKSPSTFNVEPFQVSFVPRDSLPLKSAKNGVSVALKDGVPVVGLMYIALEAPTTLLLRVPPIVNVDNVGFQTRSSDTENLPEASA